MSAVALITEVASKLSLTAKTEDKEDDLNKDKTALPKRTQGQIPLSEQEKELFLLSDPNKIIVTITN